MFSNLIHNTGRDVLPRKPAERLPSRLERALRDELNFESYACKSCTFATTNCNLMWTVTECAACHKKGSSATSVVGTLKAECKSVAARTPDKATSPLESDPTSAGWVPCKGQQRHGWLKHGFNLMRYIGGADDGKFWASREDKSIPLQRDGTFSGEKFDKFTDWREIDALLFQVRANERENLALHGIIY